MEQKARAIVVAMLLGDACVTDKGTLCLRHSERQRDYCQWKLDLLCDLMEREHRVVGEDTVYAAGKPYKRAVSTLTSKHFRVFRSWAYRDGHKTSDTMLRWLNTPEALAIWFMDDGSFCKITRPQSLRHPDKKYECSPLAYLATDCFPEEEVGRIVSHLEVQFGLHAGMKSRPKDDHRLYSVWFNGAEAKRLWYLIRDHVAPVPSMRVKFQHPIRWYGASETSQHLPPVVTGEDIVRSSVETRSMSQLS